MAARGSIAKEQITNQILKLFPEAFPYEKEIRIPVQENGEIVQIKVTLTAAKVNVEQGGDSALPGVEAWSNVINKLNEASKEEPEKVELTQEEKNDVAEMIARLGL